MHRVFVYGTLKRGEPNHSLLLVQESVKYIGVGQTVQKYPLVIATKYNIPFLLKKPGTGNQITGEIYDVETKVLHKLDDLEEHPSFYVRTEEDVLLINETEVRTKAWIYFLPTFKPSLLAGPMYSMYSNNGSHGLKYQERYLRDPYHNHHKEVEHISN